MNGQQLDRRDAQLLDVINRLFACQARIGPAQMCGDLVVRRREALRMQLIQHRVFPCRFRGRGDSAFQGRGHTRFCHVCGAVLGGIDKLFGICLYSADNFLGIGIQHQLFRIEAVAVMRLIGPIDAVAVNLPSFKPRHIAMPDIAGFLRQRDALQFGLAVIAEQAQLDARCMFRIERKVDAAAIESGAEGIRCSGLDGKRIAVHKRPDQLR